MLSNDSFQEFHGDYDWLFDEGRLIGGKPVPHVGWVFVAPNAGARAQEPSVGQGVRSRATGPSAKQKANRRVRAKASDVEVAGSSKPDESTSPSSSSGRGRREAFRASRSRNATAADSGARHVIGSGSKDHVNELMPFLEFVANHPVGTSVHGEVESYASHGAYARTGDVLIYIPLRLMDDPAPRSARSALEHR